MMSDPPTVLILADYFLPGYKAGGPIRSLSGLVAALKNDFRFRVVTRDRDIDGSNAYPGVDSDVWRADGETDVLYLSPGNRSLWSLRRILRSENPDVLYLNSFFSPVFSIQPLLLRWLGLIPRIPVILAPRGEFSRGALAIKAYKKRVFLLLSNLIGLHRGVTWHASSAYDEEDIRRWVAGDIRVIVAPVLSPNTGKEMRSLPSRRKAAGSLKLVFISRIARMKNLDGALRILNGIDGEIVFDIYGPLEDPLHWKECMGIIAGLPRNIRVEYKGVLPHDRVMDTFRVHDVLFLPTHGENFGHVILEAMASGCPVLISDRTPWKALAEAGAGWDLPLSGEETFRQILKRCVEMDEAEYRSWSDGAREFAARYGERENSLEKNRGLFRTAIGLQRSGGAMPGSVP